MENLSSMNGCFFSINVDLSIVSTVLLFLPNLYVTAIGNFDIIQRSKLKKHKAQTYSRIIPNQVWRNVE